MKSSPSARFAGSYTPAHAARPTPMSSLDLQNRVRGTAWMNDLLSSQRSAPEGKRLFVRAGLATFAFVFGVSAIGCGGGTTGFEKLDGSVPSVEKDAGMQVDVALTPDVAPLDVIDATAESPIDISVRPDVTPPEEEDAGPRSDGQRMRDGVVVRDGIIIDPTNDATTSIDAAREAGPSTVCGDGKKEGKEECDDGNTASGDGCSGICTNSKVCDDCMTSNCVGVFDPEIWPLCAYVP